MRIGIDLSLQGVVGKRASSLTPDFYVDSVNGDDGNDGLTAETALATLAALKAVASDSDNIGLARGSRLAPLATEWLISGRWTAFGDADQHMPFVDGSLPVTVGDIEPHATLADTYEVTITHAVEPYYTNNVASNGPHVGLWWETTATGLMGEYIEPVFTGEDQAAAEAFVGSNPGRCYVHKVGSTTVDVRTETSGATLRYVFQLADSSDPRLGGALRYACYHNAGLAFAPGAVIEHILFGRNTRKDCVHGVTGGEDPSLPLPVVRRAGFLDPGCHGIVGMSDWDRVVAYSRTPGSRTGGGGAWHNFTTVYDARVPNIQDSYIRGFTQAAYSHGVLQPIVLASMVGRRLRIEDCNIAFSMPALDMDALFEDIILTRVTSIQSGYATVRRFSYLGTPTNNRTSMFTSAGGALEDFVIDYDTAAMAVSRYVTGINSTVQATVEAFGDVFLRRGTFSKPISRFNLQDGAHPYLAATIENCAGIRTVFTNNPDAAVFLSVSVMENSYIGPIKNGSLPVFTTLAEYQAKVPGAADDVILYNESNPVTFAGDPLGDPTITGPAAVVSAGMGVDPALITVLPAKLAKVPSLKSMGLVP